MNSDLKQIAVLGSTGSVGRQTLDVVRNQGDRFRVVGLGAGRNIDLLIQQAKEFQPSFISFEETDDRGREAALSSFPSSSFLTQTEIASHPDIELVVVSTSGKAGLAPTLAAIRAGKQVALANKELLVMAGEIVMAEAKLYGIEIAPVDSEHSAIWQCLQGESKDNVTRLILTASGGPFSKYSIEELAAITPEQALNHPTWHMGSKITIDSATLMNKGLEIIEARWLFDIPAENIEVVIHPESIVHSMVEFADGSIKAQLSPPDMRLPIQYALSYPDRFPNANLPRIDWDKLSSLTFGRADLTRFPCLKLAMEALNKGGTYPAVLCAADEVAVGLFLSHRIGFTDISRVVEETMDSHQATYHPSLIGDTGCRCLGQGICQETGRRPMSISVSILIFIGVLLIVVITHEMGHFFASKAAGVKVLEFAIGFPPKIFSIKRGETDYSLNLIPLGAFVRTAGESDPTVTGSLASKSPLVRIFVYLAGPLTNVLLAFILFAVFFLIPAQVIVGSQSGAEVGSVTKGSPAYEAGVETGDIILEIDGTQIHRSDDMRKSIKDRTTEEITLLVKETI